MAGPSQVLRTDASALPMADASVDLIVTSPPYWSLRSYTDGGEHYDGQIGAEPTPGEYVANLIRCTREWMRVLKPSGSLWVNLGDKYAQDTERSRHGQGGGLKDSARYRERIERYAQGGHNCVPRKSLIGLPWRYAIACVDDLGLILRAEVIWSKPNGLPESVTDRVRRSHEQWFHFTKSPRYFSAVDTIREPYAPGDHRRSTIGDLRAVNPSGQSGAIASHDAGNPLGKLPGTVWTIATQPLRVPAELGVDHFAAFPMEWPRRIISGWSPSGICTACGEGRRPSVAPTGRIVSSRDADEIGGIIGSPHAAESGRGDGNGTRRIRTALGPAMPKIERTITGETCACPDTAAPTRPAVVIDPFGGTGTTALVASVLGRTGISIDMSADYCRVAAWRTADDKQRARAAGVKPRPVPRRRAVEPAPFDQSVLFDAPAVS